MQYNADTENTSKKNILFDYEIKFQEKNNLVTILIYSYI